MNTPNPFFLFVVFLLFVGTVELHAQYRSKFKKARYRFNAGITIGAQLTQIDGDRYQGFNKTGIRGGLLGSMYLGKRSELIVGLLYNQKGARFEHPSANPYMMTGSRCIRLNYMELPLLISFRPKPSNRSGDKKKLRLALETGFSFARMINSRFEEPSFSSKDQLKYEDLAGDFYAAEINYLAGVVYYFNKHIGLGLQYTLQLNKVYSRKASLLKNPKKDYSRLDRPSNDTVYYLRNYQVGLQLIYKIL